jgi:hypothetical protein
VGKPGLTVNLNKDGHRTTVGLPGSGLSYQFSRYAWDRQLLARLGSVAVWLVVAIIGLAMLFSALQH